MKRKYLMLLLLLIPFTTGCSASKSSQIEAIVRASLARLASTPGKSASEGYTNELKGNDGIASRPWGRFIWAEYDKMYHAGLRGKNIGYELKGYLPTDPHYAFFASPNFSISDNGDVLCQFVPFDVYTTGIEGRFVKDDDTKGNEFLELESNISFNLDGVSYSGSGYLVNDLDGYFAVDDEYVPYAKSEEKMPDIFPYIV